MDTKTFWITALVTSLCIVTCDGDLECYSCNNAASDEECNLATEICTKDKDVCILEYSAPQNDNQDVRLKKGCKNAEACESQEDSNTTDCWGAEAVPGNPWCVYCCDTDFCNKRTPCLNVTCPEEESCQMVDGEERCVRDDGCREGDICCDDDMCCDGDGNCCDVDICCDGDVCCDGEGKCSDAVSYVMTSSTMIYVHLLLLLFLMNQFKH